MQDCNYLGIVSWPQVIKQNIARGTTNPGYWFFNLSYLSSKRMPPALVPNLANCMCHILCGSTCISSKFDQQVALLALILNLANSNAICIGSTKWCPSMGYKFGHQEGSLASIGNWATKWPPVERLSFADIRTQSERLDPSQVYLGPIKTSIHQKKLCLTHRIEPNVSFRKCDVVLGQEAVPAVKGPLGRLVGPSEAPQWVALLPLSLQMSTNFQRKRQAGTNFLLGLKPYQYFGKFPLYNHPKGRIAKTSQDVHIIFPFIKSAHSPYHLILEL